MPESLSPELIALRDRADRLAAQLAELRDDESLDGAERARLVRAASKEAGVYATGSVLAMVVARDTLAARDVDHLDGVFGPAPGVLAAVGEPLRSRYLLPMLAGERRAGFAFTEPPGAIRATWARVEGDDLVINGAKSYVTRGADADFLTALVDVEGTGASMVVIDTAATGVRLVRRFASIDGSHHAAFEFHDVRVPRVNVVGPPGQGTGRAMEQITATRIAMAASCVGWARWVLDHVTVFLTAPGRAGQPRGSGERARLRFGEMAIDAFAARSMLYRTARLAEAGENVVNEAIACKVFATETTGRSVDAAMQLVGGESLIAGHPLEVLARRVRALRLAEGESDTLRINIARGRLDLGKGRA